MARGSDRPMIDAQMNMEFETLVASVCHLFATEENGIVASKPQEFGPSRLQSDWSLCLDEVPYVESRRRYVHHDQRPYCYCCDLHRGFVGVRGMTCWRGKPARPPGRWR